MANLLTSKKKVETGVWNYRGYIITKCTEGWEVTESPETRLDLNKQGKKTIKDICAIVDEKVGELEDYEKPQKKEKKAKSAVIKKKGNKTASDIAAIKDRSGIIFSKMADEIKVNDIKIYPPFKDVRGNTTNYKWNDKSRKFAELQGKDMLPINDLDLKLNELVDKYQTEYRDYKFKVVLKDNENTLKITYLE